MSGGGRKTNRYDELQAELNRQALVEIGKRLAELEKKFWDLEQQAKDLNYSSGKTLEMAKRLQLAASRIVRNIQAKKSRVPSKD